MILPFSTQLNGKPTHFVEKIIKAFGGVDMTPEDKIMITKAIDSGFFDLAIYDYYLAPKIHTIRKDKNNRWKVGTMIDFFINARKKNMFRFAPRIPVVSTQKIKIVYENNLDSLKSASVFIDNHYLGHYYFAGIFSSSEEVVRLAINDGFDSVEDFFNYFNQDFEGKIIHWTDLKY